MLPIFFNVFALLKGFVSWDNLKVLLAFARASFVSKDYARPSHPTHQRDGSGCRYMIFVPQRHTQRQRGANLLYISGTTYFVQHLLRWKLNGHLSRSSTCSLSGRERGRGRTTPHLCPPAIHLWRGTQCEPQRSSNSCSLYVMITALALLLTNRKHTCALSSPLTRTFYGTEFGHCLRHDVGASAMSPPRLALHPTPSPAYTSRFPRDMPGNNAKRSTQSQRSMPTIAESLRSNVCHSSIHGLDPSLHSRHGKRAGLQESDGTRKGVPCVWKTPARR